MSSSTLLSILSDKYIAADEVDTTEWTFTGNDWFKMTSSEDNITINTTVLPVRPQRPSLTEILMQTVEYRMSLALGRYGCPVQVVVGTLTNLLTLLVMTRPTMITSSTCWYFALLAVADLMVLYFSCLRRWLFVLNDGFDIYIQTDWSCRFMDFFSYLSFDLASWILTAMTVDRFVAIRYPLKAAVWCTVRNASIAVTALAVLCIGKNMHFFFTSNMSERNGCLPRDEHEDFRDNIWPWLDATWYSFLPFMLLFIFNVLIIHFHRMAVRRKITLQASSRVSSRISRAKSSNFNQRLTTMLLLVSFAFMVLTTPKVILISIRQQVFIFLPPSGGINYNEVAKYSLISAIFNFLMWTNHTINFFLYCMSGKRFRQELLRMTIQCLHCKHQNKVFANDCPQSQQALPRRGSNSSVLSDDIGLTPVQLPTQQEDTTTRVNRWATVIFNANITN